MSKKVLFLVSNDISTDQRVDKTLRSLMALGFEVSIVGRLRAHSTPIERSYSVERLKLFFDKGPLFYLELNIRFFFRLMKKDWDIVHVNDLDTLLAGYLAYVNLLNKELVYDSHEFFTEVPELKGRMARKAWLIIEQSIFPRLKRAYTVSSSIAAYYSKTYEVKVNLLRNVPPWKEWKKSKSRSELGLPETKKILILQGAGINVSKGAEEAVLAMKELSDEYVLLFAGGGDVIETLKEMSREHGLEEKVLFRPLMPYKDLMQFTLNADLGLSLEKGDNLNYEYALPNKLFDYMAAGIPVLTGSTVESRNLVKEYGLGNNIEKVEPNLIAQAVKDMFAQPDEMLKFRANAKRAYMELNWEKESEVLKEIYAGLV